MLWNDVETIFRISHLKEALPVKIGISWNLINVCEFNQVNSNLLLLRIALKWLVIFGTVYIAQCATDVRQLGIRSKERWTCSIIAC